MSGSAAVASLPATAPRWPGVVGVIGIVLAILTLLDKVGDLFFLLFWTDADWVRSLGREMAVRVVPLIPPASWIALTSLVWAALAILLLRGSIGLRGRRPSAVDLCRLWSWLAIGWFTFEMVVGLWWLEHIGSQISALAPTGWQGYAVLGILMAVVLMLTFPVFLLVWLSRPAVRQETARWRRTGGAEPSGTEAG